MAVPFILHYLTEFGNFGANKVKIVCNKNVAKRISFLATIRKYYWERVH